MKLKDHIKICQEILIQEGEDIEVTISDWGSHNMLNKTTNINIINVKPHYSGYFVESALTKGGFAGRPAFVEPYQSQIEAKPTEKVVRIS